MFATIVSLLPAGSRKKLAAHLALTVLSVVLQAVSVVLLIPLVTALFSRTPAAAWPWVAALAVTVAIGWVLDWGVARLAFQLGFSLLDHGQANVAEHLTRLRLTWFDAQHTAAARHAIAATGPEFVGLFAYLATPAVRAVLLPIAIGIALVPFSIPLGVAALLGVPLLLAAYWLSARFSRTADRAATEANSALTERIVEFARTQAALRAAGRVAPNTSHAGAALAEQHRATLRLLCMQIPGQLGFSLASQLALLLLAGTAVLLALEGTLSAPAAVALMVVIARYLEPFTALAGIAAGMEGTLTTLRRIRQVLDAPQLTAGTEHLVQQRPPRLELRGVSFDYDAPDGGSQGVLAGLDLTFEPGSTTAIVGPSGSGKSTILALLAGLHHPSSGQVTVDGVSLTRLDPASRRSLTSVVFQHPFLFDTTVRENVLVGNPQADADSLEQVATLARVDRIVAGLADGWASRVGERGGSLSGGERQRISIARALLHQAPVLLVDEATSALDAENEAAVAAALSADPVPRTRVIVAHRLSSIRAADRVVFLDRGHVIEDGSIEELLAAGGRFAQFWQQQHDAAGWRLGN